MSRTRRITATTLTMLTLATAACTDVTAPRVRVPGARQIARTDTLRGTLRRNGDDAVSATDIVLITTDGAAVFLRGPVADLLANAGGMDLWVSGELTSANEMVVRNFAFRDGNDACELPLVKILPDLGVPCDEPAILRPMAPNNRAVWNWRRP